MCGVASIDAHYKTHAAGSYMFCYFLALVKLILANILCSYFRQGQNMDKTQMSSPRNIALAYTSRVTLPVTCAPKLAADPMLPAAVRRLRYAMLKVE